MALADDSGTCSFPCRRQVERGTLASAGGSSAERVLRVSQTISYWRNNQDRIRGQLAVFGRASQLPESVTESPLYRAGEQYGAILPEVGTVPELATGHAVGDRQSGFGKCM